MYSNYNMYNSNRMIQRRPNNERFGGFIGPLLLGGVAGYAIGNNNGFNNNNSGIIYPIYPRPYYYPYPMYPYTSSNTSNYYYY